MPKPDKVMGQMPALFIVWEKEGLPSDELAEILGKKIDKFKIPRSENIYAADALPRTSGTGKIMKRELAKG